MTLSGVVLVTGGAGFIGSHITARLLSRGARVRVLDDLSTGHRENLEEINHRDLDFVAESVTNAPALKRALDGVELIYHEAAIPSVPRSVANPLGRTCLRERHFHGARRCATAACGAWCTPLPFGLWRSADASKRWLTVVPYAVAKLVGEYYCQVFTRSYGLETVALRYFNVFGPRQDPSSQYSGVISRFISSLMRGERPVIFGDGEQSRDFTYIDNVVEANMLAAETTSGVGQVMNVANGQRITLNCLLDTLKEITSRMEVQAEYKENRPGDVRHSLADITRAQEMLGYQPKIELTEGLRRTLDWWKQSRFAKD
ncbi:MAG: NAD-dependent epimerase/dehydratase family protein [Pyrinomonadaceae bacterium]